MTAAAALLKIAQPALGVQIRQLETGLGVDLRVRHSRGVTPTPAGSLLAGRARKIVADVNAVKHELKALGRRLCYQPRGYSFKLALASRPTPGKYLGCQITKVLDSRPRVSVE